MLPTTQWLLKQMKAIDIKWERAIRRPSYKDEPKEGETFTPTETLSYWWADSWRRAFHWFEGELYQQPDVRAGLVEGLSVREEITFEPNF